MYTKGVINKQLINLVFFLLDENPDDFYYDKKLSRKRIRLNETKNEGNCVLRLGSGM